MPVGRVEEGGLAACGKRALRSWRSEARAELEADADKVGRAQREEDLHAFRTRFGSDPPG
jgi:hypothetical protein